MNSTVKYRIPNQEITQLSGGFEIVENAKEFEGFLVNHFNSNKLFGFVKDESTEKIKLSDQYVFVDSKESYIEKGKKVLNHISNGEVEKTILSRIKAVKSNRNLQDVFNDLCVTYPKAFVYMISDAYLGDWVGATPEVLLKSKNNLGSTMALAGTLSVDAFDDWTQKEIEEQRIVESSIETDLNFLGLTPIKSNVYDKIAGPVKHLCTDFSFELSSVPPIDVALKLSPTPAVSGMPKNISCLLIEEIEQHNRALYAGIIGVVSKNETNLYVNLRSARKIRNEFMIFVGGGYTKDSVIEKEWLETERKAQTLIPVIEGNNE